MTVASLGVIAAPSQGADYYARDGFYGKWASPPGPASIQSTVMAVLSIPNSVFTCSTTEMDT